MNCFGKKHDNYLQNFILPLTSPKKVLPISFYNYINLINGDVYDKCENIRKSYLDKVNKSGNYNVTEDDLFKNYPVRVSCNKNLLGSYVSNLPYCKYLERSTIDNVLLLKLDLNSKHEELNILCSILRENFNFKKIVLEFIVDTSNKNNFLELSHITYDDIVIYQDDEEWLELIQSAFTELTLILSIDHAIWHLIVAHIIYITNRKLYFTDILKVFNMASKNVFIKELEVKTLLFGTELIFGQILNDNEKFQEFLNKKLVNFVEKFNIDTIFEDYFNLNEIDSTLNWMPGMKKNIEIIKNFVSNIVNKKDLSRNNSIITDYLSKKYNNSEITNIPDIKKLLEILFVVGTAFHSTTFEFTKLIFTDIFNNKDLGNLFYGITIQTIITDISTVFGDESLYTGKVYKDEVKKLNEELEENRKLIEKDNINLEFKNNIFSTPEQMLKTYSTNTYTTYV
jgi:hypothetical protein